MKRMSLIALSAVIVAAMALGFAYAAEQDTKKYLQTEKDGNGIKYEGKVQVSEIGEENLPPASEVVEEKAPSKPRNLRINYTGKTEVQKLGNGVKVYSMPMKGEWFRLGEGFSGANSISEMLKIVCNKLYVSAVLEDNNLTQDEAKKLPVGFGVFIRHAYLQDKYKFSLEKIILAYGEIELLKEELKAVKGKLAGNVDQIAVAELEKLQKDLAERTALVEKLNGELCLRDEKIAELEKENAELKQQIVSLKADLAVKETEVVGLKDELASEREKRTAFAKEVRSALDGFLKRLDELEK